MSLDFSFQQCVKNGTLKQTDLQFTNHEGDNSWSPMAFTVPWAMAAIGMGSITHENATEVWRRISLWQATHGSLTWCGGEPYYLTQSHINVCIGFTCNVSNTTKAAFNKSIVSEPAVSHLFETLRCKECGSIAHGLRDDGRCPNCDPYTLNEEVA